MINILSIDLDWIMEPSIQVYNSICKENAIDILQNISPGTVLNADLNKYAQISDLLFTKCKNLDISNVAISDSHADLSILINQWNIDKNFVIYNIDHHHDCGYLNNGEPITNILDTNGCGNWVPRIFKTNKFFSHYIWIGNKNSDTFISDNTKFYLPPYDFTTDIKILDEIKIDKLFICRSFAWIPPNYRPLLNSFITAIINFISKEK